MTQFIIAIIVILLIVTLLFSFYLLLYPFYTLFTGKVPFVPTPNRDINRISELMRVGSGDVVYDLGCGDARILTGLAQHHPDAQFIGIENEWLPYVLAKLRASRYHNVTIRWQNFFKTDLRKATHIFVYLFPELMDRLAPKFNDELQNGACVVSNAFTFSDRQPDETLDSNVKKRVLFRYNY